MTDKKHELQELVRELTGLGEDEQELQMWDKIFDCLNSKQQDKLLSIYKKELLELQALKV